MRASVEAQWYGRLSWLWLLLPLVPLFRLMSLVRRRWLQRQAKPLAVPVIVVGNIVVGGTGKTPVIIALVEFLQSQGVRPGVISRGYGGTYTETSLVVSPHTPAGICGDEPKLIAQRTGCPVVVGRNRRAAAQQLLAEFPCDLVLCDDGLQHYALHRDLEIVVMDAQRGLGNGWCLPLGPLRESPVRLAEVDWVLDNGGCGPQGFQLAPNAWLNVRDKSVSPLKPYPWSPSPKVLAIAGIGNPARFFASLQALGLATENRAFADHQAFTPEDLAFAGAAPLLMTTKDAVKCDSFAQPNWWALEISAQLSETFLTAFWQRVRALLPSTQESL